GSVDDFVRDQGCSGGETIASPHPPIALQFRLHHAALTSYVREAREVGGDQRPHCIPAFDAICVDRHHDSPTNPVAVQLSACLCRTRVEVLDRPLRVVGAGKGVEHDPVPNLPGQLEGPGPRYCQVDGDLCARRSEFKAHSIDLDKATREGRASPYGPDPGHKLAQPGARMVEGKSLGRQDKRRAGPDTEDYATIRKLIKGR